MNLVLADTEEFRRLKRKQNKPAAPGASSSSQTVETEEKRTLGLVILRGAQIISLSVESPPPADPSARLGKSQPTGISSALSAGPGVAKPAGRGAAPPSLAVRLPNSSWILIMKLTVHRARRLVWEAMRPRLSRALEELLASLELAEVVSGTASEVDIAGSNNPNQAPLPLQVSPAATSPLLEVVASLAARLVLMLEGRHLASTLRDDDEHLKRRWVGRVSVFCLVGVRAAGIYCHCRSKAVPKRGRM